MAGCDKCGAPNPGTGAFCDYCGTRRVTLGATMEEVTVAFEKMQSIIGSRIKARNGAVVVKGDNHGTINTNATPKTDPIVRLMVLITVLGIVFASMVLFDMVTGGPS